MDILNKLGILYNTCDSYQDLWEPFFQLFIKYGRDLTKSRVYINTETKSYKNAELKITNISIDSRRIKNWGGRLRNAINNIQEPYILFLLDDFFLTRDVDIEKIKQCISWMENDKSIGCMNLIPLDGVVDKSDYEGFGEAKPGVPYRLNAQACIWRKEVLYQSILDDESPWTWEIYGNRRNNYLMTSKVYTLLWGEKEPFCYGFYIYGKFDEYGRTIAQSGVMRGKWNLKVVKRLFKENDISVDFSKRGIYKVNYKIALKNCKFTRYLVIMPYRIIKQIFNLNSNPSEEKENREYEDKYVTPYLGNEKF